MSSALTITKPDGCRFCDGKAQQCENFKKIIPEIPAHYLYFENSTYYAMPDKYQLVDDGLHILVIPKVHTRSILDMPPETDIELMKLISFIDRKLRDKLNIKQAILFERPSSDELDRREVKGTDGHARIHLLYSCREEHTFMPPLMAKSKVYTPDNGRHQIIHSFSTKNNSRLSVWQLLRDNVSSGMDYLLVQNGAIKMVCWSEKESFEPHDGLLREVWQEHQQLSMGKDKNWQLPTKDDPMNQELWQQKMLKLFDIFKQKNIK